MCVLIFCCCLLRVSTSLARARTRIYLDGLLLKSNWIFSSCKHFDAGRDILWPFRCMSFFSFFWFLTLFFFSIQKFCVWCTFQNDMFTKWFRYRAQITGLNFETATKKSSVFLVSVSTETIESLLKWYPFTTVKWALHENCDDQSVSKVFLQHVPHLNQHHRND